MAIYIPTIMGPRYGVRATFLASDYNNGYELFDHGWFGNTLVGAVMTEIDHCQKRVAWIDICDTDSYPCDSVNRNRKPYQTKLSRSMYIGICEQAKARIHKTLTEYLVLDDDQPAYLINHDRKSYVDLNKYRAENKYKPNWSPCFWCLHPLPILTACGENKDYKETYPDFEKVGSWAFDLIELSDTIPNGYVEEEYHFKEDRLWY